MARVAVRPRPSNATESPTSGGHRFGPRQIGVVAKQLILGRPIATRELRRTLLPQILALPVFSSDALSSIAYATQEMLLVLGTAGVAALALVTPISFAVAALFVIVVVSYRQTVHGYPTGGGAYRVAHENLGVYPGLLAAAALLIDYVLTVAVSVTAGIDALIAISPGSLHIARLPLTLIVLSLVAVANLRGARESAVLFAIPTYGFVASIFGLILVGAMRCLDGCPQAPSAALHPGLTATLSAFLVLRAFAAGTTALTGVEAISNGVQAFREPRSHNAATTLSIMGAMAVSMLLGVSWLAHVTHVVFTPGSNVPVVAQVGEAVFGRGWFFVVLQLMTAAILVLAANTAYQDFPRLSSILATDRYMPRSLMNRGDRLVFSNGIVVLTGLAGGLLVAFDADLNHLIQLYLIGVFVAFTMSQSGMVVHWRRVRQTGWRRRAVINAVGACITGTVLMVVLATKFLEGAWMVVVATPLLILAMRSLHHHYGRVERALATTHPPIQRSTAHQVVILLDGLDSTAVAALAEAKAIPASKLSAISVGRRPIDREMWANVAPDIPLLSSHDRALTEALAETEPESAPLTTLVLGLRVNSTPVPHIATSGPLRRAARATLRRTASVQLLEPIVHRAEPPAAEPPPRDFIEQVCVIVPSIDAASMHALDYGQRLGTTDVRAVHIALDPTLAEHITDDWAERIDVPLDVHDAPYRHFAASLDEYITGLTRAHPNGVLVVVVPELITELAGRSILHTYTSREVQRALLAHSNVSLAIVPFRVRDAA